jgi:hypothetical protein
MIQNFHAEKLRDLKIAQNNADEAKQNVLSTLLEEQSLLRNLKSMIGSLVGVELRQRQERERLSHQGDSDSLVTQVCSSACLYLLELL